MFLRLNDKLMPASRRISGTKLRPLTSLFVILIIFVCLETLPGATGEGKAAPAIRYFDWKPAVAGFSDAPRGRALANIGNVFFAIGGMGEDGNPLREIEIIEYSSGGVVGRSVAQLSEGVAFAGVASLNDTIYLVGGIGAEGTTDRVVGLKWNNGVLQEKLLPPLPRPVLLPGVALQLSTTRYYLVAMGGAASREEPEALDTVHELSLEKFEKGTAAWVRTPPMPQGGRIAPMVVETFNELVVVGGYSSTAAGDLLPTTGTWGYSRTPRDGQEEPGWKKREPFATPVAQPAFAKTGQSHLVVVGGDSAGGTLADLLDGTKAMAPLDGVWAFHDVTDTWVRIGEISPSSVGGHLAVVGDASAFFIGARAGDGSVVPSSAMEFAQTSKRVVLLDWIVIAAYFIGVALVGVYFARRQKNAETFSLGGRRIKWWATGISMAATGVSTISFMAIPALVACMGLTATSAMIFLIPSTILAAFVTFPLLRRLRITSTFEYLEQRFGISLRLVGSFQAVITSVMARIGMVVMLPALAISTMTGIDPVHSVLAMGIITTVYSAAGGYEAVIWTDVAQGMLMFGGFILIGVLAFLGIDGGMESLVQTVQHLDRGQVFITKWDLAVPMIWFYLLTTALLAMAFAHEQPMAQRVFATPLRDVRKLAYMYGATSIAVSVLSTLVGLSLLAFFRAQPELLSPVMKNDQFVPIFLVNKVPAGLAGLLLATLFAAAMSTISSSVNSSSILIAEDFYKRFKKDASSHSEMWVMRLASVLIGLLGTAAAIWLLKLPMPTLWETFQRIIALLAGGFVGIFILGMFTRRTHSLGAITGLIVSIFVAYKLQFSQLDVHWSGLGCMITLSCVITGYVVSLVIPWHRKDLAGLTVWDQLEDPVDEEELLEP